MTAMLHNSRILGICCFVLSAAGACMLFAQNGQLRKENRIDGPRRQIDQGEEALPVGCVSRLGTTRFRHHDCAECIAISPDGKMLASSGGRGDDVPGNPIRIWDVGSGKQILELPGHVSPACNLVFSPDGRTLASIAGASANRNDDTVRIWSTKTGKLLHCLAGHKDSGATSGAPRYGLAFSSDGRFVASSGRDGFVRIWNVKTGKERANLPQSEIAVALAFSQDGKVLAIGGSERVRLMEVSTGREIQCLKGMRGGVSFVRFSVDGKHLISGSGDRLVRWWDLDKGKLTRKIQGHVLGCSCKGYRMAIRTRDRIIVWDGDEDREIRSFSFAGLSSLRTATAAISENGDLLFMGNGSAIQGIGTTNGDLQSCFAGHHGRVVFVAFSRSGHQVISSGDTSIRFWAWRESRQLAQLEAHDRSIESATLSKDGATLVTGSSDGSVRIWDVEKRKLRHQLRIEDHTVPLLALSPNSNLLATRLLYGRGRDTMQLWGIPEGNELRRFGSGNGGSSLSFLADGRSLVFLASSISVYDSTDGKIVRGFEGMPYVNGRPGLGLSPDECIAVTAHPDPSQKTLDARAVTLWEMASGTMISRLRGLDAAVTTVAFSPGGHYLVSAGWDGVLRFWDVASGKELASFYGHRGGVLSLAFSPDGKYLASGGADTTILIWDMKSLPTTYGVKAPELSPVALTKLWVDLFSNNSSTAYAAIWRLTAMHDDAVSYIREKWHGGED